MGFKDMFIGTEEVDLERLRQMVRRRYNTVLTSFVNKTILKHGAQYRESDARRHDLAAEKMMEEIEESVNTMLETLSDVYIVLLVSMSDDAVFRESGGINEDVGPMGDAYTVLRTVAYASVRRDALNMLADRLKEERDGS